MLRKGYFKKLAICKIIQTNVSKKKLQTTKMKYLRKVKGIIRIDIVINKIVRKELEIEILLDT